MEISEIASKNGYAINVFGPWVKQSGYPVKPASWLKGEEVPDELVEQLKHDYQVYLVSEPERKKAEQEEKARHSAATAGMLISSGFSFDGYTITKYSGYISGDDCITIPRSNFFEDVSVEEKLPSALTKVRRKALEELKEAAYDLGCNAVIGVDFDYMVIDPQHSALRNASITVYEPYVICVTANGNAVYIEKDE